MVKAIINANIVLERGIIWDGAILISESRISDIQEAENKDISKADEIIDAKGAYVGPGFIDIHVHGGNGYLLFKEPLKAADFFLMHGTTSILAAPYYGLDYEALLEAFKTIKSAMVQSKNIKGIYCEGPYINPNYGAESDLNPWRTPIDENRFKALVDEAGTAVKVWTIAPEREGLFPFLSYARTVNPNVIFALGHSDATPEQIHALGKYKPKLLTHAMCATGRRAVPRGTRGYGPDEYCLNQPEMYAELISDSCGIHVNPTLQQVLLKAKGISRMVLISDSFVQNEQLPPPHLAHIHDLNFDYTGALDGSRLTLNVACRNIMRHTNCGIAQTFIMASTNPAHLLGMDDEIGSIEIGKIADLVFTDDKFNIHKVMLGGDLYSF
ncbi:MAG: amidohydrolase family protein [Clostridia bacterium]|nr:amidohydrolase family protein [Clostridia bacterium]